MLHPLWHPNLDQAHSLRTVQQMLGHKSHVICTLLTPCKTNSAGAQMFIADTHSVTRIEKLCI
jgi:hypothetical protein